MKRIQYHSYGGPELMRLEEVALPAPGQGEIAVRVKAASINPVDWKVREGWMKIMTRGTFPRGMGTDFAGLVEAVGPGVTRLKPGDAVFGVTDVKRSGAFAEKLVVGEKHIAVKPDTLSFEQAACLPVVGLTAWRGLVEAAKLKAGQHVFVSGCMGGVGQAAVQLAQMLGARVGGSCNAASMEQARQRGIDPVIDYKVDHSPLRKSFDVVYETSGHMPMSVEFALIKPGGMVVDINPSAGKLLRSLVGSRLKVVAGFPSVEILNALGKAAAEGKIKIAIGKTVPLEGAITLLADLEAGKKIGGKGLIVMG